MKAWLKMAFSLFICPLTIANSHRRVTVKYDNSSRISNNCYEWFYDTFIFKIIAITKPRLAFALF